MPRRARQPAESQIYHVMLRGVNRAEIFLEPEDYDRFLVALARVRDASGCQVLAYCLMPNHVHLVLRTPVEPIGSVMKRLGVRYAGWFNRKYGRVGHLFQDRFRSIPVEDDAYLVTLLRYVWDNPVKAGLATLREDYPWSSRGYLGGGSPLVSSEELRRLVPLETLLSEAGGEGIVIEFESGVVGRPAHAGVEAAEHALRLHCGCASPDAFALLDALAQRRAVQALRTHGVPYHLIGKVTGMSTSAVRRLHLAA